MISKLISDIEMAFSNVEYPGDYNIAPMDGMEGSEANDAFKGKSWKDIQHKYVSELSFALIYFKPKAFIYYLPAFMIGCIHDQEAEFGSCCHSILSCFIPPDNNLKEFNARMRLLTKEQSKIVMRFLHYLVAIGDQEGSEIQKAMNCVTSKIDEA